MAKKRESPEEVNVELIPCPFCGVAPIYKKGDLSDIYSASAGGFELRHICFENIGGNDLAVRWLTIKGETKADVVKRWNGRSGNNGCP